MNYGLVQDNRVTRTSSKERDGYIEIPDHVQCGWIFSGGVWQKSQELADADAIVAALATKKSNVTQAVVTLRTWAQDAQNASDNWASRTQLQRDTIMSTTFARLSTLMSRFADHVETHKL